MPIFYKFAYLFKISGLWLEVRFLGNGGGGGGGVWGGVEDMNSSKLSS